MYRKTSRNTRNSKPQKRHKHNSRSYDYAPNRCLRNHKNCVANITPKSLTRTRTNNSEIITFLHRCLRNFASETSPQDFTAYFAAISPQISPKFRISPIPISLQFNLSTTSNYERNQRKTRRTYKATTRENKNLHIKRMHILFFLESPVTHPPTQLLTHIQHTRGQEDVPSQARREARVS